MIVNPFIKDGEIRFPLKPLRDLVFLIPDIGEEKIGSLYIPEAFKEETSQELGVIVAIGEGYIHPVTSKFIPTQLKVGMKVVYDKGVPHKIPVKDSEGVVHQVRLLGERDCKGVVLDE